MAERGKWNRQGRKSGGYKPAILLLPTEREASFGVIEGEKCVHCGAEQISVIFNRPSFCLACGQTVRPMAREED